MTKRKLGLCTNLLLQVNDLPAEFPPPSTKQKVKPSQRKGNPQGKVNDARDQFTGTSDSDSDSESVGGYWLRIPASWNEPRTTVNSEKPNMCQREQVPVRETRSSYSKESMQTPNKLVRVQHEPTERLFTNEYPHPETDVQDLVAEHSENKEQTGAHAIPEGDPTTFEAEMQVRCQVEQEHLPEYVEPQRESGVDVPHQIPHVPQSEDEQELPQCEHLDEQEQHSGPGPPMPLRRSTRERRPGKMLTYSSLGHPTYQSCPTVNAVETYISPYTHLMPYTYLWCSSPDTLPFQRTPLPQYSYIPVTYSVYVC